MSRQLAKVSKQLFVSDGRLPAGYDATVWGVTPKGRVFKRCDHDWVHDSDSGIDSPEKKGSPERPLKFKDGKLVPVEPGDEGYNGFPGDDDEMNDQEGDPEDPDEELEDPEPTPFCGDIGVCQAYYEKMGNSKAHLLAMCWGITHLNGRELGDVESEPHKSCSNKKKVLPSNQVIKAEIVRRAGTLGLPKERMPKCTNWNRSRSREWMMANPVTDMADVAFLACEEEAFYNKLQAANVEKSTAKMCTSWTTLDPWLRLLHAAAHEEARPALLLRDQVLDRNGLQNRNAADRAETYEEIVTRLFNDESRTFVTSRVPNLHSVFSEHHYLSFDKMPGPITPKEVKSRLADARAKLVKVIGKWELSGNGFGQRALQEDGTHEAGFGHLEEEHFHASDNRASFLGDYKEYILHVWHLFDTAELLDTVLAVLSKECSLETEDSKLTFCSGNESTRKRKKSAEADAEEMRAFRAKFGAAMSSISYSTLVEAHSKAQDALFQYQLKEMTPGLSAPLKAAYKDMVAKQQETVDRLAGRLGHESSKS